MQSFLTQPEFSVTASHLDDKRLNKQRVECKQIYASLTGISEPFGEDPKPTTAWQWHPAVVQWRTYEALLCQYALFITLECDKRGMADNTNMKDFFFTRMMRHEMKIPRWWTDPKIRSAIIHSHRCNLARKNWKHYMPLFPELKPSEVFTTAYVWPSQLT